MCGICGIVDFSGRPISAPTLTAMRDIMTHRGPDDAGTVMLPCAGLGHRRLSIIDLAPRSRQPMCNEDETVWVTFNGEIYNYRELRAELAARGHVLRTESDTETIVHLYEDYGEDFVHHINGMFAIGLWDARLRKLLLLRDRLGVKPLYYAQRGSICLFASETKAILEYPELATTLNMEAVAGFFNYSSVPGELTCFNEIRRLLPGHMAVFTDKGFRIRQYWDIPRDRRHDRDARDLEARVAGLVKSTVESRMISDVPVGAFLSGGVDSSLIAAVMTEFSPHPVEAFSIGYGAEGAFMNETPYAVKVAQRYGMNHRMLLLDSEDLLDDLDKVVWHLDEPCGDPAAFLTLALSRFSREHVTVALSGLGADEFFGGYRRYLGIRWQNRYLRLPAFLRHGVVGPLAALLPESRTERLGNYGRLARKFLSAVNDDVKRAWSNIISYLPVYDGPVFAGAIEAHTRTTFKCDSFEQYWSLVRDMPSGVDQVMFMDAKMYLVDQLLLLQDKMSMAVSLEIREPFLDYRLVELAASIPAEMNIPGRNLKAILKKVAERYVPRECIYRGKMGFCAPISSWLRGPLKQMVYDVLNPRRVRDRGILQVPFVEWMKQEFYDGKRDLSVQLYQALMLELWMQRYVDRSPRPAMYNDAATRAAC